MSNSMGTLSRPLSETLDQPMDMVSPRYAKALFLAGYTKESYDFAKSQLEQSPELYDALCSPAIGYREKRAVIGKVFEQANTISIRFLELLCKNGRMDLFFEIYRAFCLLSFETEDTAVAQVTSAYPMSQEDLDKIRLASAGLAHHKKAELFVKQDPTLLGGFVLKIGDKKYDSSVKGSLDGLKHLLGAR